MNIKLIFYFILLSYTALAGVDKDMSKSVFANKINHSTFEENQGQLTDETGRSEHIKFRLQAGDFQIFVKNNGLSYQYTKLYYSQDSHQLNPTNQKIDSTETHRVDMILTNANSNAKILTYDKQEDYINYYTHNILGVRNYKRIVFQNIYPHIDWELIIQDHQLKYNFIVHPGGDINQIIMKYKGQDSLSLDSSNNLIIHTQLSTIVESKPFAIQEGLIIPMNFQLTKSEVKYQNFLYDKTKTIILDPVLRWATYYMGENRLSIKADSRKNIYLSTGLRSTTVQAYLGHQINHSGGLSDALIVKFNPQGQRKWSSYYGGSGDENFQCLSIDSFDNVYAAGRTISSTNIAFSGFQMNNNGINDGFVVKFDSLGTRIWATYFGGKAYDEIFDIAVGDSSNVYLFGRTYSNDFPLLNPYRDTFASDEGFISKLSPTGSLIWSTYYGGNKRDQIFGGCVLDDYIYITGNTASTYGLASNSTSSFNGGFDDAFIAKFNKQGQRIWGRYFGGTGFDLGGQINGKNGSIYCSGVTNSPTNIGFNGHQNSPGGFADVFLAKFDTAGILNWSTYIGGTQDDITYQEGLSVDENIYISFYTLSDGLGYKGYKMTKSGGNDVCFAKYKPDGSLIWRSYYGGNSHERVADICSSTRNEFYLSGTTRSTIGIAFNGFQDTLFGIENVFLAKFTCGYDTIYYDTICRGDSVLFRNKFYKNTGIFKDSLLTWDLCDSFITLHLTVLRKDTTYLFDTICAGSSYVWNGVNRITSGVYRDTLVNNVGCDSFLILNLLVKPTDTVHVYDTSCNNLPKTFNGQNLTVAGVYRDTLQNSVGCDSHIFYHFIPKPIYETPLSRAICAGDSNLFGGVYRKLAGIFYDTLKTIRNCDSVLKLTLTINPLDTNRQTQSICRGKSYNFYSQVLTSQGTYSHKFTNRYGCDSLILLTLALKDSSSYALTRTICKNQFYSFNNQNLNTSGIYRDTLTNAVGCDSFITLTLLTNGTVSNTIEISRCHGDIYQGFTQSGTYVQTLTSHLGCDSLLTINLTYLPTTEYKTISHSKCGAFSYGSRTYTRNDSFTETIKNYLNCDSIVMKHLVYITEPHPKFLADKTIEFCEEIMHKGQLKTMSFFTQDTIKSLEFPYCDSLYQPYYYRREGKPVLTAISKQIDTVIKGETTSIRVSGAQNYRWTTGEQSPSIRPQINEDKTFEVTAWNLTDCEEKMKFNIYAIDQPLIDFPTAFSPNGDGLNDYFTPNLSGNISIDYFQIFNRWGEKVYEHSPLSKGWDGSYLGKPAANGFYTYTLRYSYLGRVFTRSGEVMVVR
jgi:gliding motility-associated-like protein